MQVDEQDIKTIENLDVSGPTIMRLRRIEGQIRGLQRMLEEGRDCSAVLTQLMAARAALDAVGQAILEEYLDRCLESGDTQETRQKITQIVRMFLKLS
jgi:DNA-binding FrmR family transcriptional regulator